jgi:hypothetical protein
MTFKSLVLFAVVSISPFVRAEICYFDDPQLDDLFKVVKTVEEDGLGQFQTSTGKASFVSDSTVERIESDNNAVQSIVDFKTGKIAVAVPMANFGFKNSLMKEHFHNEEFLDTKKFPKAKFSGDIQNIAGLDLTKPGPQKVILKGFIEIHGVKKEMFIPATFELKDGNVVCKSKFSVQYKDFGISLPLLKRALLNERIDISMNLNYTPKAQ